VSFWKKVRRLLAFLLLVALACLAYVAVDEFYTSRRQAAYLSGLARQLTFNVEPGKSDAIRYPGAGPYDERLGYAQLPRFIDRLEKQNYAVTAQARMSPRMLQLRDKGLFAIYREKDQAGLEITDCRGGPLYAERVPERVYPRFEAVPPLLVDSLLFIENRELLDDDHPMRNPAVEWDRFTKAALDQARHLVDDSHHAPGGSTLATQIEKYRHSPEGRTDSGREKLRQMASASIRAYLHGEDTMARRREIVLSYLNTVPLSAKPGFGEVNGLGDGLWAWYGRDFAEVNRLLSAPLGGDYPQTLQRRTALAFKPSPLPAQALAYKQALSLMIAQRRPSHYLVEGEADLQVLTDSYLRVMADAGIIPWALRDAALPIKLKLRPPVALEAQPSFVDRKAANTVRNRLQALLDVPRAYDLDRLDLRAASTLDSEAQRAATQLLRGLRDPEKAKAAGLYGFRLLQEGDDPSKLVFSFTLFERTPGANLLRVQTDNVDQPFDLNEGARLDLGSTAKLRTMVTYLELVAEMHAQWAKLDPIMLAAQEVHPKDPLGRWAKDYLLKAEDKGLKTMLLAAMERSYSGSPGEVFYTGGGAHRFENFEREEDYKSYTVREAIKHSVNLSFIRIMRDIVYHVMSKSAKARAAMLEDADDPARQEYLSRFADQEGKEFLSRFYRKYQGKDAEEAEALLLQRKSTPVRLAALFYGLEPQAEPEDLGEFLEKHLPDSKLADPALQALHDKYGPERWSLSDRGYLAGVHPLELWLVAYLRHHPKASLGEVYAHSKDVRQEVYTWLFKTRHKGAQDLRIRNLIEQEAFAEIQRRWKRLGYPFETLTPSYATALGASGDRPAALAELMGILVNHGLRLPTLRVPALQFGRDTPYETRLQARPATGERVLPAEVADVAREAVIGVVEEGTAKRLKGVYTGPDGQPLPVGGKTGTGDHRFDVYGKGGALISSRVVNRTATFVFFIGDRYYGTMMAYVHEPYAAKYRFTSAMPSQLLKTLHPALQPLLQDERHACPAQLASAVR
jgi:membrane peptidoglycan carboxypeptidase